MPCYLNDYVTKNQHNQCFRKDRKKHCFPTCQCFYSHDHMMQVILLFIIATSTLCGCQTKVLNEVYNGFRFTDKPLIHGFAISVSLLILPIFWQFFVLKRATERIKIANSRLHQQSYFISFLNDSNIMHFRIGIIFRFGCYQQPNQVLGNQRKLNRGNFLQTKYGFRIQMCFADHYGFLLQDHLPKKPKKVKPSHVIVWSITVKSYQSIVVV